MKNTRIKTPTKRQNSGRLTVMTAAWKSEAHKGVITYSYAIYGNSLFSIYSSVADEAVRLSIALQLPDLLFQLYKTLHHIGHIVHNFGDGFAAR